MEASPPTYRVFRDQHGIPQFEPKRGTQQLKDALIYAFPTLETELQLMQAALRKFFDSERTTQFVCELPENNLQASLVKTREVPVSSLQTAKASLRNWKGPAAPSRPTSRASSRASSRGRSRASSRAPSRAETPAQNVALEPLVEVRGCGIMTTWNLSNGQELERRKRQPYDPVKRRRVAENRGNACDKHRAAKTTCDPDECLYNKIHTKAVDGSSREGGVLRGRVSQQSLPRNKSAENDELPETTKSIIRAKADSAPQLAGNDPSRPRPDALWDEFDHISLESSLLSFTDINSNDSGYWTDSDCVGLTPSNYPTLAESTLENDIFPQEVGCGDNTQTRAPQQELSYPFNAVDSNHNITESQRHVFSSPPEFEPLSDKVPHHTYGPRLLENALKSSARQTERNCSGDPFMGSYHSEKADHSLQDYSWVLHHVETL